MTGQGNNNKKKGKRECIICDYGNFKEEVPISGECRRSPPRSYLESRGGTPGRFFPMVRFDDWCGQFKKCADNCRTDENLKKIAPFRNGPERHDYADRLAKSGKFLEAISVYESVFEGELKNAELAFKIAKLHREIFAKEADPDSAAKSLEWHIISTDLGHDEAPFWVGVSYAQGEFVKKDIEEANRYLEISCERDYGPAIKKRESGGFE